MLAEAPEQSVDAVLAEERLAFEGEGRYAPVAGLALRVLIRSDHRFETLGVPFDRAVEFGERVALTAAVDRPEAGASCCVSTGRDRVTARTHAAPLHPRGP